MLKLYFYTVRCLFLGFICGRKHGTGVFTCKIADKHWKKCPFCHFILQDKSFDTIQEGFFKDKILTISTVIILLDVCKLTSFLILLLLFAKTNVFHTVCTVIIVSSWNKTLKYCFHAGISHFNTVCLVYLRVGNYFWGNFQNMSPYMANCPFLIFSFFFLQEKKKFWLTTRVKTQMCIMPYIYEK